MDTPTSEEFAKKAQVDAANRAALKDGEYHKPHTSDELTEQNVDTVIRLEREVRERRTSMDRAIDMVTAFCGSVTFVWVHVAWFAAWIMLDVVRNHNTFDPYPYALLTLIVSLEAIMLSTFILISQNRDAKLNDRRNHLALQIELLSEQESTKMLKMLDKICRKLNIADDADPTIQVLEESTRPERLVQQIDRAMEAERARDHANFHLHMPHLPHHKPHPDDAKLPPEA
jgi:uncharacterized membrane protein